MNVLQWIRMNSQSKVQFKINLHKPIKGQLGKIEAKMVHKQITCNLIHKTHHNPNLGGVQHSPPYSILMWLVPLIQV